MIAGCSRAGDESVPSETPTAPLMSVSEYADEVVALTNEERVRQGLAPLVKSECLAQKASERAREVLASGSLEHPPLVASCGEHDWAGENLSHATREPAQTLEAWLESPGHARNILDPDFTVTAVSCVISDLEDPSLPASAGPVRKMLCSQLFEGSSSG